MIKVYITLCLLFPFTLWAKSPTPDIDNLIPRSDRGRIIINAFMKDGKIHYTNSTSESLVGKIEAYIAQEKKTMLATNPNIRPVIHLRCDKEIAWKHVVQVQTAASNQGVINLNFATYRQQSEE